MASNDASPSSPVEMPAPPSPSKLFSRLSPDDLTRLLLAAVLVLAAVVRCAVVFGPIDVLFADETFQYTEQAHRLVFGAGVVPWEYVVGIRSWLLPGMIAAVLKASSWFSDNPLVYIQAVRLISSALSLSVVYVGFKMALRVAGPVWAGLTGALAAIWYESLFFAPSLMGETLAAFAMFVAVLLAERRREDDGTLAMPIGILLGLAFCLRFHTAPALLVIAAWYSRVEWRERWLPLILGALAIVVPVLGLLDFVTLGSPFQSVWLNIEMNVFEKLSDKFGLSPFYAYFTAFAWPYNVAALPLLFLVAVGAFRAPLLALTALTILVSHSFIGHKEFRFICFTLMAVPILAGIGLATCADFIKADLGEVSAAIGAVALSIFLFSFSLYGGTHAYMRSQIDGVLKAFVAAHDAPGLCGLGVAGFDWRVTGGYTFFHRAAPIYYSNIEYPARVVLHRQLIRQFSGQDFLQHQSAYNYLVAPAGLGLKGYDPVQCFQSAEPHGANACLLRRQGGCS
jgi:phosphatidylinositol glycan class B